MTPSHRSFLLACSGTFTGFLTIGLPLPIIPAFVHDQLGFDMVITGLAIGLQSLATVLTRRSAGHRADVIGSRPTARRGLVFASFAGVIYVGVGGVAPFAPTTALGLFLLGRVLLGYAESLILTGALTWGIALIGSPHSGKVMSWNGIAMHASLALGAPLGILIYDHFGFTAVALASVLAPLAGLVTTAAAAPGSAARAESIERAFAKTVRSIWKDGAGLALGTFGFGALSAFIATYFRARDWPFAGLGLTVFGTCYVTVRLIFGTWPDRRGGRRTAQVSLVIEAIGQWILWRAESPYVALVGVALTGAGFSLLFPSFGVRALTKVPPERRGTALGAFSAFFDVALGSTGPACGWIIATCGVPAIYGVGGLLATVALLLLTFTPEPRRAPKPAG